MTKFRLFHLKNEMLIANTVANVIGVFLVNGLMLRIQEAWASQILEYRIARWADQFFSPFAFISVLLMTLIYEKPIRRYLNALHASSQIPDDLALKARQRLLNEPFFLIGLDFAMWLLAAVLWSAIHWTYGFGMQMVQDSLYGNLSTGLITVTVAFFLLEHLLQKRLAPHFFPDGGLSGIPKTLQIRIRTRLFALLMACNLIPLTSTLLIMKRVLAHPDAAGPALEKLQVAITINALAYIGVGICLTILVGRNLSTPFKDIIRTLRKIRSGRFDKRVQVFSNDEIGYTGDAINEMAEGLIERERIQRSLHLAKEVQQNLLPKTDLNVEGFDIAGKSIYCHETGGDYYDFIPVDDGDARKVGIAIGDVSGHGISSALLMATVRSSLRQRAALPGGLAEIVGDVNRQLAADVESSGQFMTLFFLTIDMDRGDIEWVRAGHDPGILYDPRSDAFTDLRGSGIALGVNAEYDYIDNRKKDFSKGQILFLSTDGIWEAMNKKGQMMGKAPIVEIIRKNASCGAAEIIDAVFDALMPFLDGMKIEDDITSVVVKREI